MVEYKYKLIGKKEDVKEAIEKLYAFGFCIGGNEDNFCSFWNVGELNNVINSLDLNVKVEKLFTTRRCV